MFGYELHSWTNSAQQPTKAVQMCQICQKTTFVVIMADDKMANFRKKKSVNQTTASTLRW